MSRKSCRSIHETWLTLIACLGLAAATTAQRPPFDELRGRHAPSMPDALSLASGDVDGDGDPDLVVGRESGQTLLLDDGAGVLSAAPFGFLPPVGAAVTALALADFDGDADLDLFSAPRGLFLNDGTGRFLDVTNSALPGDVDSLAVVAGDLDGDGDLDLAIGELDLRARAGIRLLANDGRGRFTAAAALRQLFSVRLLLADVDGDSDLDLLDGGVGGVRLFRNLSGFSFRDDTGTAIPPSTPVDALHLAAVDLDGDADIDLFVGSTSAPEAVLVNRGDGTFVDGSATWLPGGFDVDGPATVLDADRDGDPDVVVADALLVNGGGRFTLSPGAVPPLGPGLLDARSADFDNDAATDIAFVQRDVGLRILLGDGGGGFADGTALPLHDLGASRGAVLGDIDGDDDPDLVQVLASGIVEVLQNDGAGGFGERRALVALADDPTGSVALADLDGDGDTDAVVGVNALFRPFSLRYLRNAGGGRFVDATSTAMPSMPGISRAIAVFDADVDGDLDLLAVDALANNDRLLLNDGSGRFAIAAVAPQTGGPVFVRGADVDRDGDFDLIVAGFAPRLFLNDRGGRLREVVPSPFPVQNAVDATLGDVDGDGDADVVFGVAVFPDRLFLNDGSGGFTAAAQSRLPTGNTLTIDARLIDIDGDSDLDLLLRVADLSRSGDLAEHVALTNDGTGTFAAPVTVWPSLRSPTPGPLLTGDIDRDGDVDVVTPTRSGLALANLQREVEVLWRPRPGATLAFDFTSRPAAGAPIRVVHTFFAARLAPRAVFLPPFGWVALDPATTFQGVSVPVDPVSGRVRLSIRVPAVASLSGLSFFAQALIAEGPNVADARLTRFAAVRLR